MSYDVFTTGIPFPDIHIHVFLWLLIALDPIFGDNQNA